MQGDFPTLKCYINYYFELHTINCMCVGGFPGDFPHHMMIVRVGGVRRGMSVPWVGWGCKVCGVRVCVSEGYIKIFTVVQ